MKIVVFGPTGLVGRQVTRSAVREGHDVVAFAHQPDPMSGPGLANGRPAPVAPVEQELTAALGSLKNVTVAPGDIFDPRTLHAPIAGADAVIFAAGVFGQSPTRIRSAGMAGVCQVMRDSGVTRIVAVSQAAAFISPRASALRKYAQRNFVHKLYRYQFLDFERMEDELACARELDWSIVRAAKVRDWPASGSYQVVPDGQLRRERPVGAADLADYVVARAASRGGSDIVILTGHGRPAPAGGARPGRPDPLGRSGGRPAEKEGQPR
ncbi:MAG TPA: NAD(P)-binding oxidoreductase [Trebonia sp.]|jgi:putative NADH-flavin reductase|nr:NAD(P)-binding oxidoreductase [Trebonia sp.]